MLPSYSRRAVLGTVATVALAGCSGRLPGLGTSGSDPAGVADLGDGSRPVLADSPLYVAHDLAELESRSVSGGPGQDGIPSIDEPIYADADDEAIDLASNHPVFGVDIDGDVRAYPQEILVWHEIVNDTIGGEPVAVTYCPLTGTAQGFYRGETTFGVSGDLVNSNLIMYDRGTGTRWPQILATGIDGELRGESIAEFRVIWTTWDRWRSAHPDTRVLTDETGYRRRYGDDPYGDYEAGSGYYVNDNTLFSPLERSETAGPKTVVLGTRTPDGAIAFDKEALLDRRVLKGSIDDVSFVAVVDDAYDTGYVYHDVDAEVTPVDGENAYRVVDTDASGTDDQRYAPDELPFDRSLAFDAMFFAWYGFYPEGEYVD